jgi:hypothetical protein
VAPARDCPCGGQGDERQSENDAMHVALALPLHIELDGFTYLALGLGTALVARCRLFISPSRRSARLRISRLSSLAGHRQPC